MKDKKNKTGKNKKNKKDLKAPAIPVPTAATELSEEDLKSVTGGSMGPTSNFMKLPNQGIIIEGGIVIERG